MDDRRRYKKPLAVPVTFKFPGAHKQPDVLYARPQEVRDLLSREQSVLEIHASSRDIKDLRLEFRLFWKWRGPGMG